MNQEPGCRRGDPDMRDNARPPGDHNEVSEPACREASPAR
jgi:hypothetical protein